MKWLTCFFLLFFPLGLFANSVRLINDSPYKLRAVVRANDGSFLGEFIINPQQSTSWTDNYNQPGGYENGGKYQQDPNRTQTPYSVLWYCVDGSQYAIANFVATGAWVFAQSSDGPRLCPPPKKKTSPFEHRNESEYLHGSPEPEAVQE